MTTLARVAAGRLDRAERLLDPAAAQRREALLEVARAVYLDPAFDAGDGAQTLLAGIAERGARGEGAGGGVGRRARADRAARPSSASGARSAAPSATSCSRSLEELEWWYRDLVVLAAGRGGGRRPRRPARRAARGRDPRAPPGRRARPASSSGPPGGRPRSSSSRCRSRSRRSSSGSAASSAGRRSPGPELTAASFRPASPLSGKPVLHASGIPREGVGSMKLRGSSRFSSSRSHRRALAGGRASACDLQAASSSRSSTARCSSPRPPALVRAVTRGPPSARASLSPVHGPPSSAARRTRASAASSSGGSARRCSSRATGTCSRSEPRRPPPRRQRTARRDDRSGAGRRRLDATSSIAERRARGAGRGRGRPGQREHDLRCRRRSRPSATAR